MDKGRKTRLIAHFDSEKQKLAQSRDDLSEMIGFADRDKQVAKKVLEANEHIKKAEAVIELIKARINEM